MGLMMTNGGSHPPEKWAADTASHIIDIAADAKDARLADARAFEAKIREILTHHHGEVQNVERLAITDHGSDRLAAPYDHDMHVEDTLHDILQVAAQSSFADHFAKPETVGYLTDILYSQFHLTAKVERSWHADENPDHPNSVAFHAVAVDGHGLLTMHDDDLARHGDRGLISTMVANAIPKKPGGEV